MKSLSKTNIRLLKKATDGLFQHPDINPWTPAKFFCFLCCCVWGLPSGSFARVVASGEQGEWKLGGYFKNFSSLTEEGEIYRDAGVSGRESFRDNATRLRLRSVYLLGDHVEFAAHYELSVRAGDTQRARAQAEEKLRPLPGGEALIEQLFPEAEPPRLFGMENRREEDDYRVQHGLDRAYLRLREGPIEVTMGRAALSWGPGTFWTPTDYFAPFSPTEIDKDEKVGIDILRALINLRENLALDLVFAPVRREDGVDDLDVENSAGAGRASLNILGFDLAASGGYLYDRSIVGFDAEGPVGGAMIRGALTRTLFQKAAGREDIDPYWRGIADLDYAFPWSWNPYLSLEYHFNGQGRSNPEEYAELAARPEFRRAARRGEIVNMGRHYGAALLNLNPHSLLLFSDAVIVNLNDGSFFNGAYITWSVLENLDMQIGAQNTFGPIPAEFGGQSDPRSGKDYPMADRYFVYLKWYI